MMQVTDAPDDGRILTMFAPLLAGAWREHITRELGADAVRDLSLRDAAGLEIPALADAATPGAQIAAAPGIAPYRRGTRHAGGWQMCQIIDASAPDEAASHLAAELAVAPEAVGIACDPLAGTGVVLRDAAVLGALLDGIAPPTALHLTGGAAAPALLAALASRGACRAGSCAWDPAAQLLLHGVLPGGEGSAYAQLAGMTRWAAQHAPACRTIAVDATVAFEAGAGAVDELALALATLAAHVRGLSAQQMPLATIARHLIIRLSLDSQVFEGAARLRAMRLLLARVLAAFGGDAAAQASVIHACSARRGTSRRDPLLNAVRNTLGAVAGALGGADILSIAPYDAPAGGQAGRELARATQLIVRHEAHLDEIADLAGGSWHLEARTTALARAAWQRFQHIEAAGGLWPALTTGLVATSIRAAAAAPRTIVGASHFVDADAEVLPAMPACDAAPAGVIPLASFAGLIAAAATQPLAHLARMWPIHGDDRHAPVLTPLPPGGA
ncbi:MAG: hypothetical protein KGS47_10780 [Chloroflexi bacterium]|nr:hypothetical protein [Chloroflexota bacterium]